MLGLQAPRADLEALFNTFDLDGSGLIDYRELHKMLRQHAKVLAAKKEAKKEAARQKREAKQAAAEKAAADKEAANEGAPEGERTAAGKATAGKRQQQEANATATDAATSALGDISSASPRGAAKPSTMAAQAGGRRRSTQHPLVPVRDQLLDLLPRISPYVTAWLSKEAEADGTIDREGFVVAMWEAGSRAISSTKPAPFAALGSEGRSRDRMGRVLDGLFSELLQHSLDGHERVPIAAIPSRIRKLKPPRERSAPVTSALPALAPAPPSLPAKVQPSPRVRRAHLVESSNPQGVGIPLDDDSIVDSDGTPPLPPYPPAPRPPKGKPARGSRPAGRLGRTEAHRVAGEILAAVSMHVSMYVNMHVSMCVSMCVSMHVSMYVNMHVSMCVSMCVSMHVSMYVSM